MGSFRGAGQCAWAEATDTPASNKKLINDTRRTFMALGDCLEDAVRPHAGCRAAFYEVAIIDLETLCKGPDLLTI